MIRSLLWRCEWRSEEKCSSPSSLGPSSTAISTSLSGRRLGAATSSSGSCAATSASSPGRSCARSFGRRRGSGTFSQFFGRLFSELSGEEFFVWRLGLPHYEVGVGSGAVWMHNDAVSLFGLDWGRLTGRWEGCAKCCVPMVCLYLEVARPCRTSPA